MTFSGQQARRIEHTVETILKNYIQGKLDDDELPYKEELASFGGAEVLTADQYETRAEQGSGLNIVFNKVRVEKEPTECPVEVEGETVIKRGQFMTFTYRAECIAGEFNGALVGVENPVAAEEILSGHLETIIDEGFDELAALGLEEAEVLPEGEEQEDEELNRINSHLIRFAATTVNSN